MAELEPKVIMPEAGFHNTNLEQSITRLMKGNTYKDVSTVCIIPTRGTIHARVLQSWFSLITPMNQKFMRVFGVNMEVGQSYSTVLQEILKSPDLAKWKYILTLEDDNMPPPDGLLKLLEAIESDGLDAVGGLYWTKGEGGQPMIYGDPSVMPRSFIPQVPLIDRVQPCNGLGMGFTLFRLKMFTDERIPRPWFRTAQDYIPYQGTRMYTQDLYFFENAGKLGYKFACDTRVKVGHYEAERDIVW